jgi:SAM-dependent methyltransferase
MNSRSDSPIRSSNSLYDTLAPDWDAFYEVPHRRAYDELAWEFALPLLPAAPGCVIDAGCGNGRWAQRFVELGHSVIGIEQSAAMCAAARARLQTDRFSLIEGSMEQVELPEGQADLVLALGSVQYTHNPEGMIRRFACWTRIGGSVIVLVDSLVALVLELVAAGKPDEAVLCLQTRIGTWMQKEQQADYHLLDCDRLEQAFRDAGLTDVRTRGLLVGASALGREQLNERLITAREQQMALERQLAESPLLADVGKHLLISGCRSRVDMRSQSVAEPVGASSHNVML